MQTSKRIQLVAAAIVVSLLLASPGQAGELSRGEMLSVSCAGCHGTDGHSPGSIPDISDKSAEYIRTSMEEFRSGKRDSTVMGRQAKGYTDEEIQLIAEYFAKQK
jgi:sulfide dehydrogenase cytochrome subunit